MSSLPSVTSGRCLSTSLIRVALVKRYHVEPGSSKVAAILAQPDSSHLISRIGLVEAVSAFALKVREGQIQMTDFALYRGFHSFPHRGLQNQRRVRK